MFRGHISMCVHRLRPSKEGGGMVRPNPGTEIFGPHCKSVHQSITTFLVEKNKEKFGWGGEGGR